MAELLRQLLGEAAKYLLGPRVIGTAGGLIFAGWFLYLGWLELRRRRMVYAAILLPCGLLFAAATAFLAFSE